jgi:hypothetical protein
VFEVIVTRESEMNEGIQVDSEYRTRNSRRPQKFHTCDVPLENDGAVFNMLNDSGKYSPRNDQDLCEMLWLFVSKNNLKSTVFIETPSKAFSDWSFPKVCSFTGLVNQTILHHQYSRLLLASTKI